MSLFHSLRILNVYFFLKKKVRKSHLQIDYEGMSDFSQDVLLVLHMFNLFQSDHITNGKNFHGSERVAWLFSA